MAQEHRRVECVAVERVVGEAACGNVGVHPHADIIEPLDQPEGAVRGRAALVRRGVERRVDQKPLVEKRVEPIAKQSPPQVDGAVVDAVAVAVAVVEVQDVGTAVAVTAGDLVGTSR